MSNIFAIDTVEELDMILANVTVTQKYSGKRGCCCGCLGTHVANPAPSAVKRTASIMRRHIIDGTGTVTLSEPGAFEGYLCVESGERVNILYIR